jgi:hypothetical protein
MGIWSFRIANGKLFSVTGAGVPGASGKVSPGVSTAAPAVLDRPEATASAVQHTLMQAQSNEMRNLLDMGSLAASIGVLFTVRGAWQYPKMPVRYRSMPGNDTAGQQTRKYVT